MQKEIKIGIGAAVILILTFLVVSLVRLQTPSPTFTPPPVTEEIVTELPPSLTSLVDQMKEIINLSQFERVSIDGKAGYSAKFTSEKNVEDLFKSLHSLLAYNTEGWGQGPRVSFGSQRGFLDAENERVGFKLKIEATLGENEIVNGTVTFTSL